MEIGKWKQNATALIRKYKYVIAVILIGVILMAIPQKEKKKTTTVKSDNSKQIEENNIDENLSEILSKVKGAGRVQVFLTTLEGERTVYQTNENATKNGENKSCDTETVTLTDAQRNQFGLVSQINPPIYRGAIVVCEGADDPAVQLSIINAVSNVTGLGTNRISVLKMK